MARELLQIGKALSAPARVAIVLHLFDGVEHSATELGRASGVGPATASQHLAVLVAAGLVSVRREGRHRWFALADAHVAHALEQLSGDEIEPPITSLRLSREQRRVHEARTCYDHLAGLLGVRLTEGMVSLGWVEGDLGSVTRVGEHRLALMGVDIEAATRSRRPLVRPCRDWTARRDHLAGALGAGIATTWLDRGWVVRQQGSRGLTVTESGRQQLDSLGVAWHPGPVGVT